MKIYSFSLLFRDIESVIFIQWQASFPKEELYHGDLEEITIETAAFVSFVFRIS